MKMKQALQNFVTAMGAASKQSVDGDQRRIAFAALVRALGRVERPGRRAAEHRQKFATRVAICAKRTEHAAGDHGGTRFMHAARGHTLMRTLDHDSNTLRPQHFV